MHGPHVNTSVAPNNHQCNSDKQSSCLRNNYPCLYRCIGNPEEHTTALRVHLRIADSAHSNMASNRPQTRRGESDVFFNVHDDRECGSSTDGREELDTNSQGDYRSDPEIEYSDESDDAPDEAVQDDIEKFKDTFRGIAQRFRLINRIGEGELILLGLIS